MNKACMNCRTTLIWKQLGLGALWLGMAAASPAAEVALPDNPNRLQEIQQQAADGEVAMPRIGNPTVTEGAPAATPADAAQPAGEAPPVVPRVRTFNKPNRMMMKAGVANMHTGYAFLADNRNKPGVVTLKSGLQYKVLRAGAGKKPVEQDVVKSNYKGSLIDNTVFEESPAGKSASVKVAALIPGLREAILLMPVGSRWQVVIPPELGFGSQGNPPKVGPSAVLIYDLEVLGIEPPVVEKR